MPLRDEDGGHARLLVVERSVPGISSMTSSREIGLWLVTPQGQYDRGESGLLSRAADFKLPR